VAQVDKAAQPQLKSIVEYFLQNLKEDRRASLAEIRMAASYPYSKSVKKTNVSDTEI
jgi:hypothetical protein